MPSNPPACRVRVFCEITGRPLSKDEDLNALFNHTYTEYVSKILEETHDTPAILVDDRSQQVFYVGGGVNGVIIDETYVRNFTGVLKALVLGESSVDVSIPLVKVIAAQLDFSGALTKSLMLRHERVSGLYAIDAIQGQLQIRSECLEFLAGREAIGEQIEYQWQEWTIAFLILHEIGHSIYTKHEQDGPWQDAIDNLLLSVQTLKNKVGDTPNFQEIGSSDQGSVTMARSGLDGNLVEEAFCDMIASGVFYNDFASLGKSWSECFTLLRCLQDAKRLMNQARNIASTFVREESFPQEMPSLEINTTERAQSSMTARAYLTLGSLLGYVAETYQSNSDTVLERDALSESAVLLMDQSNLVFTRLAGATCERTLYLLLKSVRAKASDPHLNDLFERIATHYQASTSGNEKRVISRIIDDQNLDYL